MMKSVENYPEYLITEMGRVWSKRRRRFLKLQMTHRGYLEAIMKAFEKFAEGEWYCTGDYVYEDNKRTWRAALEWAKTQATDVQTTELEWAIKKELES